MYLATERFHPAETSCLLKEKRFRWHASSKPMMQPGFPVIHLLFCHTARIYANTWTGRQKLRWAFDVFVREWKGLCTSIAREAKSPKIFTASSVLHTNDCAGFMYLAVLGRCNMYGKGAEHCSGEPRIAYCMQSTRCVLVAYWGTKACNTCRGATSSICLRS